MTSNSDDPMPFSFTEELLCLLAFIAAFRRYGRSLDGSGFVLGDLGSPVKVGEDDDFVVWGHSFVPKEKAAD